MNTKQKIFFSKLIYITQQLSLKTSGPDLNSVGTQSSQVEKIINGWFYQKGIPYNRPTAISALQTNGILNNNNLNVFNTDCIVIDNFLKKLSDYGEIIYDGRHYLLDEYDKSKIFVNARDGLNKKDPIKFLQMLNNNHLFRKSIENPDDLIGDAINSLEKKPEAIIHHLYLERQPNALTRRRSDVDIAIPIHELTFTLSTRKKVTLQLRDVFAYVSNDAKLVQSGNKGIKDAFEQQFEIFSNPTNRIKNGVLPILEELKKHNLSDSEKVEFLEKSFRVFFRHNIFVPTNFPGNTTDLSKYYKEKTNLYLPDELYREMGNHADVDFVLEALTKHVNRHFGEGTFIKKLSEINV